MRFLALSPAAAYALLAGTAAAIALIYWRLRAPAGRVTVPSMAIWVRTLASRRRPDTRRRWLLSLALALAIGLSIALALTRPELSGAGASGQRLVLILDNSPSMAARTADGASRWQHAVEHARAMIVRVALGGEVMVLDTHGQSGAAAFMPAAQARERIDRLTVGAHAAAQLPPLPFADAGASAHLFTDGVSLVRYPAGVRVHSVFESAGNVGIIAFDARALPADPARWQAFVQLHNASSRAMPATLTLSGGGQTLWRRTLELQPGETADETLDVSAFPGGVLRAEVSAEGDAFDRDDEAYAVVLPHQARRVLLVTPGDSVLADALRALPGVVLATTTPAAYRSAPGFDAYVFDRFAPREPPPAGALLFRPPAVPWLPAAAAAPGDTIVGGWDESSPLTSGVAWRELRAKRAALARGSDAVSVVVRAQSDAQAGLIATGAARAPWIQVAFARGDSNFHLQQGFPVFLGNALGWLDERGAPLVRTLGMIDVPLSEARVQDQDGRPIDGVRIPGGTAFEAARPGVYTVASADRRVQVVAAVLDPRFTQINRSRFADAPDGGIEIRRASIPALGEPWAMLLLVAAALLLAEWAAHTRWLTV